MPTSAGRLARRFPGNDHITSELGMAARMRHDQNRAAAFERETLREIEYGRHVPVGICLSGDDEVSAASVSDHKGRHVRIAQLEEAPLGRQRRRSYRARKYVLNGRTRGVFLCGKFIQNRGRKRLRQGRHRHGCLHMKADQMRIEATGEINSRFQDGSGATIIVQLYENSFV